MKKRFLTGLCAALFSAACLLGGCSFTKHGAIIIKENQKEQTNEVELYLFGYKAEAVNLVVIEKTLHGFMNANADINVIYEGIKGDNYWLALNRRSEQDALDDIFMIDHDRLISMSADDKLLDLSSVTDLTKFKPEVLSQIRSADGKVYFLPAYIATYNLFINYDVLERYNQSVPENYAEFAASCDYFASQGVTPLVLNATDSLRVMMNARCTYDLYHSENVASQIEGFNQNPDTLAELYYDGIDMAADAISRGWVDCEETLSNDPLTEDVEIFGKGGRPFMITGSWASVALKDSYSGLNFGVHPLPMLRDGSVLVTNMNTCLSINANSERTEEAKKLLAYILQPSVTWEYSNSQNGYMPTTDDRMPTDGVLAPSNPYMTNGRSVIGSDYRLTVPIDGALTECGRMLLVGEETETVKNHLKIALRGKAK